MSSHDLAHLQRLLLGARVVLVEDERVARVVGAHLAGLAGEDRSRRVPLRWVRRILPQREIKVGTLASGSSFASAFDPR